MLIPLQAMVNVDHKFDYLKGGHICYPLLTHRESHFLRPERELRDHIACQLYFTVKETNADRLKWHNKVHNLFMIPYCLLEIKIITQKHFYTFTTIPYMSQTVYAFKKKSRHI